MSPSESSEPKTPISNADARNDSAKPAGPSTGSEQGPPWLRYVALLTGVLAGLGGFLTVRSASLTNDAIYRSNQAVLFQARASDAWNEYQADSIKFRMVQTTLDAGTFVPEAKDKLETQAKEFRDRQPAKKQEAMGHEATRDDWLTGAKKLLNEKSSLDFAGVAVQLGIALASVAGLTRRKEAFVGGILCGAVGAGITAYVMVHHYLVK
jgi:hypothetical protein